VGILLEKLFTLQQVQQHQPDYFIHFTKVWNKVPQLKESAKAYGYATYHLRLLIDAKKHQFWPFQSLYIYQLSFLGQ
jgi:hypothetical protein